MRDFWKKVFPRLQLSLDVEIYLHVNYSTSIEWGVYGLVLMDGPALEAPGIRKAVRILVRGRGLGLAFCSANFNFCLSSFCTLMFNPRVTFLSYCF